MTTAAKPVSRAERWWVIAAIVIGAGLRLATLHHLAIEHFDEAVYASNLLFTAEEGGQYPLRQFYAPPLLPAVIEWSTIFGQLLFGRVPPWWPMLPASIAGIVTIPSVWWITRQWFSPRTGILAAHLVAFHEYHGAYCRTALTDVPLTLFVLWAVYWFWRSLLSGQTQAAVIAGVFTGLAWWTKYNGWLPLAIVISGGLFWQLLTPSMEKNWLRLVRVCLCGAATATILWLPVLWDCQKVGGYAKVAENHRGYVQGFGRWGQNLVRGYEYFDEFVGWLTLLGVLVAFAVRLGPWQFSQDETEDVTKSADRLLAECLAGAWFWGLFIATPMYHPYSRLWVPWLVVAAILLAAALSEPWRISFRSLGELYRASLRFAGASCGLLILSAAILRAASRGWPACLEPRDTLLEAALQIQKTVADPDALFVVGDSDPAMWLNLRWVGTAAFPQNDFEFAEAKMNRPAYLVMGPLSQRLDNIQRNFQRRRDYFELIEEVPIRPSRVSILDIFSPEELARHPEFRTPTVQLFRVRN